MGALAVLLVSASCGRCGGCCCWRPLVAAGSTALQAAAGLPYGLARLVCYLTAHPAALAPAGKCDMNEMSGFGETRCHNHTALQGPGRPSESLSSITCSVIMSTNMRPCTMH
jgi:hypothetical protein